MYVIVYTSPVTGVLAATGAAGYAAVAVTAEWLQSLTDRERAVVAKMNVEAM